MVFSSITFIYYFLPIVLLIYFLVPTKYKNLILLISSLLFYFYGEPVYIWVLLLSCFINYMSALLIEKNRKNSKKILILTIIIDLGLLMYFKYTNFFIDNINTLLNLNINTIKVIMPIGISFFTFQTLSYVIDVYTKKVKANKNFITFSSSIPSYTFAINSSNVPSTFTTLLAFINSTTPTAIAITATIATIVHINFLDIFIPPFMIYLYHILRFLTIVF